MTGMVTRGSRGKKKSIQGQARKTLRKSLRGKIQSPIAAIKRNFKSKTSLTANVDSNKTKPSMLKRAALGSRRPPFVESKASKVRFGANIKNNNHKQPDTSYDIEFIAVDDQTREDRDLSGSSDSDAGQCMNDESDDQLEMIVETLNSESDTDSVIESQVVLQSDHSKESVQPKPNVQDKPSEISTSSADSKAPPANCQQELQPLKKSRSATGTEAENPRLAALANVYKVLVDEKVQEFYNCTSCKMRFTSIHEHIMKYHQTDNVVIREVNSNWKLMQGSANMPPGKQPTKQLVKSKANHADNAVNQPTKQLTTSQAKPKRLSIMRAPASERQAEKKQTKKMPMPVDAANAAADDDLDLFHCKACDMVFDSVEEHVRKHHSANEPVIVQNKTSTPSTSPTKPIATTADTDSVVETFHCQECEVEFESVDDHIRDFHPTQKAQFVNEPTNEPAVMRKKYISKKATADTPSYCSICDTQFLYAVSLKLHMRMHLPVKPITITDVIDHTEIVSTTADCSTQQVPATSGGASDEDAVIAAAKEAVEAAASTKSTSIEGHGKKATFFCAICDKRFSTRSQAVHEESHRQVAATKSNLCDICNKSYDNPVLLEKHRAVHVPRRFPVHDRGNKPLPYECRFCQKMFARPNEKIKHERCHTGDKPHSCHLCGKTFRIANSLSLHLRTHSNARPYVCVICNKRYKTSVILNTHMLIHSDDRPYQCRYCATRVKTIVQLASHENHHTKPFSCSECNRPFASMFELKGHILSHKNNSHNLKHVCQVCGAAYTRDYALKSHIQEKHSEVVPVAPSSDIGLVKPDE